MDGILNVLYFNQCPHCGGTVELKYDELKCLHCAREWSDTSKYDQSNLPEAEFDFDYYKRLMEDDTQ